MIKKLKNLFWNFYINSSPKKYDDKHKGSFDLWRVIILNLIRPGRILKRFKYNQIFISKNKTISNFEKKVANHDYFKFNSVKINILKEKLNNLVDNGVVVIPEYFSLDTIENFKKKYDQVINKLKQFDSNIPSYNVQNLAITKELNDLWLDTGLLSLVSSYFDNPVFARNYPELNFTYVPRKIENETNEKRASDNWHVDHAVLFNIHVLLEDINENETCMEVIPKTQKKMNYASNYSHKVIQDLKIERIKCFGKKGTVYMHTGNVVHRLNPVEGSNRLNLHFEFSPGTNILLDVAKISKTLSSGFNLDNLTKDQRNVIKGIYPLKLLKGYDVEKNTLSPNKFKGI